MRISLESIDMHEAKSVIKQGKKITFATSPLLFFIRCTWHLLTTICITIINPRVVYLECEPFWPRGATLVCSSTRSTLPLRQTSAHWQISGTSLSLSLSLGHRPKQTETLRMGIPPICAAYSLGQGYKFCMFIIGVYTVHNLQNSKADLNSFEMPSILIKLRKQLKIIIHILGHILEGFLIQFASEVPFGNPKDMI